MRLIFLTREKGARISDTGIPLHKRLVENIAEGTPLLKFAYNKLYNGKLALQYGYATTNEYPVCHLPASYTHIAGECKAHRNLPIRRHTVAC
jgi:hypothetical protein